MVSGISGAGAATHATRGEARPRSESAPATRHSRQSDSVKISDEAKAASSKHHHAKGR